MNTQALTRPKPAAGDDRKAALVKLVTDTLPSEHSRRAYGRAVSEFLDWYEAQGAPMTKALVVRYVNDLREAGKSPANINQRLSAVKKLMTEAADNNLFDDRAAEAVRRVKGIRTEGRKVGNWLTREQAQDFLNSPFRFETTRLKAFRDRAILAVALGGGFRRSELAGMTVEHVRQLDGRWVVADLVGKRGRVRTVPIPAWAKVALDAWTDAAGITSGVLFRSVDRHGNLGKSMSAQAVHVVVDLYARKFGLDITPHDLRRTFAKLAHKGGSPIDQIQITLGHASIQTTEIYLGVQQNLTHAPCDVLGLNLETD